MAPIRFRFIVVAIAVALALTAHVTLEAVDVKVGSDPSFDFSSARTWGWNPAGAGDVKMARTKDDDPDAMKKRVDPLIREAVAAEMNRRGLKETSSDPDLTVTYFLLLTAGSTSQDFGQFLPATAAWGLPMFQAGTQSLEMMNKGSLVLDMSAKGTIVWRGAAQAKIEIGIDDKKREARLREGVRDLLKRYPPKK